MNISHEILAKRLKLSQDLIHNYKDHLEATEYHGCEFSINHKNYIFRVAKVTPKKVGFFVTLWKRDKFNITTPFSHKDQFDFLIIICIDGSNKGRFLFSKNDLIEHKILSTNNKNGKRGFRVYPDWSDPQSKQALTTQLWQRTFFSKGLNASKLTSHQ